MAHLSLPVPTPMNTTVTSDTSRCTFNPFQFGEGWHISFRLAGASARGLGGFGQDLRSIWQSNSRLGRRSARACAETDFRETSGTT